MEFVLTTELEEKIKNAESLDEFVKICAKEGIEVTREQLEAEVARQENGDLSEEDLDNVSGGIMVPTLAAAALIIAVGYLTARHVVKKKSK